MNKQITVAVDLDGTLAEYSGWKGEDYIGDPLPDVQQVMSELADIGAQIIIFTTRGNEDRVAEWLNDSDIPFDHINENPDQPPGASHKVIADRYWDDRTPGWKGIRAAMDELGQYLQSQQPEQFARPLWRQAKSTAPPDTAVVIRYAGRLYAFDGDADVVQHALAGGKVTCPVVVAEVERYAEDSLKERIAKAAGETDTNPTDEQIEAENYKKGKFNMHGLQFSIENPKGSIRSGDGWQVTMKSHYGYILRTESDADGDHVDCFIGPDPESEVVFVVDQVTEGGKFDEHKCMIGWTNEKDAREAYLANYSAGWKCGPITAMTLEQFKVWLEKGDTGARVEGQVSKYRQAEPAEAAEPNTKAHWVSEIGPRGGKRWINANAPGNKPIYQDEMPGEDEAYRTIPVGKEDPAVTEALYPTQSSEKSPEEPGEPPEPVSEAEQIRLDAQAAAGEEPEAMGQPPAEAPAEQEPTGRTAQDVATAFGFTPPSDNPNQNERQANTYVLRAAGQMGFAPTATNRSEAARQASEYLSAQSTMLTGTIAMAEQHGYQGNPSRGMVLNAAGGAAHLVNTVRQQGLEPQGDTAQEVMASAVAHLVEGKGDDAQSVVTMLGSLASAVGMMSVMYLASRFGGRTGASVAGLIVGLAHSLGHQQEGRSPKTVRSALEYLRGGPMDAGETPDVRDGTSDVRDIPIAQEVEPRQGPGELPDETAENLTAAWDGYKGSLADQDGVKAKMYSEEIKSLGGDLDKPPWEESVSGLSSDTSKAKPDRPQEKPGEKVAPEPAPPMRHPGEFGEQAGPQKPLFEEGIPEKKKGVAGLKPGGPAWESKGKRMAAKATREADANLTPEEKSKREADEKRRDALGKAAEDVQEAIRDHEGKAGDIDRNAVIEDAIGGLDEEGRKQIKELVDSKVDQRDRREKSDEEHNKMMANRFEDGLKERFPDRDDRAIVKDVIENLWNEKRREISEWNTARKELLSHILPDDPAKHGAFTRQLQRAEDASKIPKFDEAMQIAERDYGWFLEYDKGESSGKNNVEAALFKALRRGQRKDPVRHDPALLDEALHWIDLNGGWPSEEGEEPEETEQSRRKEAELRELEAVPFSLRRWLELARYAKWQGPNTGPRGGVYWISSETGLKHYGERPPEGIDVNRKMLTAELETVDSETLDELRKTHNDKGTRQTAKKILKSRGVPIVGQGKIEGQRQDKPSKGKVYEDPKGTVAETDPEEMEQADSLLKEAGATREARSESGSSYYTLPSGQQVRVSNHAPNHPTQNWMNENNVKDVRLGEGGAVATLASLVKSHPSQTTTPEFRKWFGDSKVVDESGEPLRVFHGTNEPISEFPKEKRPSQRAYSSAMGHFFTDAAYATGAYAQGEGANVMPVYLSLQNPKIYDDVITFGEQIGSRNDALLLRDRLVDEGYDGVIVGRQGYSEYVAFDPTQIKSATGNRGTFDPKDPRITYQRNAELLRYAQQLSLWDEESHPREESGKSEGGQFADQEGVKEDKPAVKSTERIPEWHRNRQRPGGEFSSFTIPHPTKGKANYLIQSQSLDVMFIGKTPMSEWQKKLVKSPQWQAFVNKAWDEDKTQPIDVDFHRVFDDDAFGITGTGHAKMVIDNVISSVTNKLKQDSPPVMVFTAKEPSRARLYAGIVRRAMRKVSGYTPMTSQVKGIGTMFFLVRNDNVSDFSDLSSALGKWELEPLKTRIGDPSDPRINYRRTGARMKYQEPTVPPPHAKGYRARIRAGLYQWITRDGEGNRKTFLIWNISPGRGLGNLWSAAPVEEENGQKTVGKAVLVRKTLTGIEDGLRQMLAG